MQFQRAGRRIFNLAHLVVVEEIPPKTGTEQTIPPPTRVTTVAGYAYELNGPDAEPLWRRLEEFEAAPATQGVPMGTPQPTVEPTGPPPPRSPIIGHSGDTPSFSGSGGLEARGP